jgi:aspartyl-tRNA(Asn)/glutamyl-tRNA(Gln) amidotransferase subunit A
MSKSLSLHQYSVRQQSEGLIRGQFSALELTDHYLKRIKKYNRLLNGYVLITEESARKQAGEVDAWLAEQDRSQLKPSMLGIPMAHKDILSTKGIRTTCCSKQLHNYIPPYDATIVKRLNHDAQAIMLGKANMDEFAMGSTNATSAAGLCFNPWVLDCVPGGSSGGSAALVAARLAPVATGTDTGGSIRQPAAFCGITGLKPTYGRVSRYGLVAFASSLDQAGPMAPSAEDIAIMFQSMAGHDPKDSTSVEHPVDDYLSSLDQPIKGLKIGIPEEFFSDALDSDVANKIQAAIGVFKKLGAEIKSVHLKNNRFAVPAYYIIASSECSSNLSRFDGVRYGYRCEDVKGVEDLYKRSRSEGFGEEVKRRILLGTFALSSGFYDAYYQKAQQVRQLIAQEYAAVLDDVDVILGPTTVSTAFKHGEGISDPIKMYLSDIYTIPANLAGFPAISAPCGFASSAPVGFQLTGKPFSEAMLLNIVHRYQKETDWHARIPETFDD